MSRGHSHLDGHGPSHPDMNNDIQDTIVRLGFKSPLVFRFLPIKRLRLWYLGDSHPLYTGIVSLCQNMQKGENTIAMLLTCSATTTGWFIKHRGMCCHNYMIMHLKDPWLSVVRVEHGVSLGGFCLSPYREHVLKEHI